MWLFKRGCTKTRQDLALAGLGSCWGMSTARPGSAMGQSRSARRVPLEAPAFGENLGRGGEALGAKSTHLVDRSGSPYAFVRHLLWGSTCCLHLLPFTPMLKGSIMSHPCPLLTVLKLWPHDECHAEDMRYTTSHKDVTDDAGYPLEKSTMASWDIHYK